MASAPPRTEEATKMEKAENSVVVRRYKHSLYKLPFLQFCVLFVTFDAKSDCLDPFPPRALLGSSKSAFQFLSLALGILVSVYVLGLCPQLPTSNNYKT